MRGSATPALTMRGRQRRSPDKGFRQPRAPARQPAERHRRTRSGLPHAAGSYLIALLGGEAGLRAGEIVALEWADVDLERRQIRVRHSDWCGELTAPKKGRI